MNITTLLNSFKEFCVNCGFELKPPIGLLSPIFPHEFNVSGGHNYAMEVLNNQHPITPLTKYALFEKCFRRIDLERVGYSDHHLSFFQVLLFAYAGNKELVRSALGKGVIDMVTFLTQICEIPKKRLVVTVFNGGKVKNFDLPKEPFSEYWTSNGFSPVQIIPIEGRRNLAFSETEGTAVCPTCEILFDRGKPFEKSYRFVEIGSVNLYKYLYRHKDNKLDATSNWVLINVVGVERLLMVLQEAETIFNIDSISPVISIIEGNLQNPLEKKIWNPSIRVITDAIRAISFICAEGVDIDSTPQGKILKKLVKQLVSQMRYLCIYDIGPIEKSIDEVIVVYKELYPNLRNTRGKVINLISHEITKREEAYG